VVIELKGDKEVLLMEDITEPSTTVRPEKKRELPRKRKTRRRPVRRR
jgi:hypothetical protein